MTPSALADATAATRGLQSAADKTKLDALPVNSSLEARFAAIESGYPAADSALAASIAALTTAAVPDSSNRRYVTDAQRTVIGNTSGANSGDVTLPGTVSGWLSLAGQALTFALVAAGAATDGVVNQLAQTWTGVKTFASAVVMSAGLSVTGAISASTDISSTTAANGFLLGGARVLFGDSVNTYHGALSSRSATLYSTVGTGSTDVATKAGTSAADGSTHASAKLFSIRTGIGGTEVEKAYFEKSGSLIFATDAASRIQWGTGANTWQIEATPGSGVLRFGNNGVTYLGLRYSDGYAVSGYGMQSPVFESDTAAGGVVLKSANGNRWRVTISNAGALVITAL